MVSAKSFYLKFEFLRDLTIIYLSIATLTKNVHSSKSSKWSGMLGHNTHLSDNAEFSSRSRHKRSTTVNLSNMEIQQSIDKHNDLRMQEGASDMYYMVWDEELASIAQDWADNCDFIHDLPVNASHSQYGRVLGQNLYISPGFNLNIPAAIQLWFDEKNFYNFDTNACDGMYS